MEYDEEVQKMQTNPLHREEKREHRQPQSSKKTIKVKQPELSLPLPLSLSLSLSLTFSLSLNKMKRH